MTGRPLLEIEGLAAGYGAAPVIAGLDLTLATGEAVALLGPNGAGKTTLLKAILGLLPPSAGRIRLDGIDLGASAPERRVALGLGYVPEGRRMFPGMSVLDNLLVATRSGRAEATRGIDLVFGLFPELAARRVDRAWRLSGGQQQMLALGRALMGRPRVLLLDEPMQGLGPGPVAAVAAALHRSAGDGTAILWADAGITRTAALCRRFLVLRAGRLVADTATPAAAARELDQALLGEPLP